MIVINIFPSLDSQSSSRGEWGGCRCSQFSQCWEQERDGVLLVRLLFIHSLIAVSPPTLPPSHPSQLLSLLPCHLLLASPIISWATSPTPASCTKLLPSFPFLTASCCKGFCPELLFYHVCPPQNLSYCPMTPVHLSYCQLLAEWESSLLCICKVLRTVILPYK